MKVILTGSHGVGKTTLVNSIKDTYKEIVVPEQIRVLAERFPSLQHSQEATTIEQNMFFEAYLREFVIRNHYIADRGLIDIFAYTKALAMRCKTSQDWAYYNYEIARQEGILKEFVERYPNIHYIYIPIEFALDSDNFQDTDTAFQKSIDSTIRELFATYCKEVTIIKGSPNNRRHELNQLLDYWWDHDNLPQQ